MCQHEGARAQLTAVAEPHAESLGPVVGIDHGSVAHVHGREVHELLAPGAPQLDGRHAVLPEQPSDRTRLDVRGPAGVDDEHVATRPPEDQRSAQARRSAPDDHSIQVPHARAPMPGAQAPPTAVQGGPVRSIREWSVVAGHVDP